jgi:hypothetical protein
MKTKRNFAIVLTAVLVIAAIGTAAWAAETPIPKATGLAGSWTGGTADEYMEWMAIHTPGTNPTGGEMLMNWVKVDPRLIQVSGLFPGATRLTPGHGVWEKTEVSGHFPGATRLTPGHGDWEKTVKGQYMYTWYAYGMGDIDGNPVRYYTVRVTGLATMTDSDNVSISYRYDVFGGYVAPQDMSTTPIVHTYSGDASEKRLTLVTP